MKTFRCLVLAYRWSFETDEDIIVSPSGVALRIPAHHYKRRDFEPEKVVTDVIVRSHATPEKEKHGSREFAVMHLQLQSV